MKIHHISFAACLLLFCGCFDEAVHENSSLEESHKVYAVIEDDDAMTKTCLSADNKVLWMSGDRISVFRNSMSGSPYQVSDMSVGNSCGVFECVENKSKGVTIGANVAFYPYKSGMYCSMISEGSYEISGFEFPSVQAYAENSFAGEAFPMAAVAEVGVDDFSFRNVCGALKLLLTGDDVVKSLTLQGNGGELVSGPGVVSVSKASPLPSVSMDPEAGTSVCLDCGAGVRLDPEIPTEFIITLPPTDFESGFNVIVENRDGAKMKLNASGRSVVGRSSILRMPEIAFEPTGGVRIEAVSVSFDEILISVKVEGAVQYSGGYMLAEDFSPADVQRDANWKIAPRIADKFEYTGPLTGFPDADPVPVSAGQTYVVWVAPYMEGQKSVAADEIVYREFTVPQVLSGGELTVECLDVRAEMKSVEADLSAAGASVIYSAFMTETEAASCPDDASLVEYLFSEAVPVHGEKSSVTRSGLSPGMNVKLIAVAVDSDGRYGALLKQDVRTAVPVFDDSFHMDLSVSYNGKTAYVDLGTDAENMSYVYFIGKTSSSSWNRILGGMRETAEEYMAANRDSYVLENTDENPLTDGCIVFDGIEAAVEYVVVVMAVSEEGVLSRAYMKYFTPTVDLGDFVYRTGHQSSQWKASRPEIGFGSCFAEGEFYVVNWFVKPAEGMKAYAACVHPNSVADCENAEDLAIRIYNIGQLVIPAKMETLFYGDKGNMVYVTWCDEEGNFYETYSVAVPQN